MTALPKYLEGTSEKIAAYTYTPGSILISDTGEMLFDSIKQGKRIQLNGNKIDKKASDVATGSINDLTTGGTYQVSAGLAYAPTSNAGLLLVIQGTTKISQLFTDTATSFIYSRVGNVAGTTVTFGSWVSPNT